MQQTSCKQTADLTFLAVNTLCFHNLKIISNSCFLTTKLKECPYLNYFSSNKITQKTQIRQCNTNVKIYQKLIPIFG